MKTIVFFLFALSLLGTTFANEHPALVGGEHEVDAARHPELVCHIFDHFERENLTHITNLKVQVVSGILFKGLFMNEHNQIMEISGLYKPWENHAVQFNEPIVSHGDVAENTNGLELHHFCASHEDARHEDVADIEETEEEPVEEVEEGENEHEQEQEQEQEHEHEQEEVPIMAAME